MILPAAGIAPLVSEGGGFNPIEFSHWANFLWTVVIFLVALPFMWKIVWGPMARALEARDHDAERAVQSAEAAKAAAEKAQAEVERRLADAQKESTRVLAEARALGEAQGRDALVQAQAQAQQTLDRAKAEIEREKARALSEIRESVVDLSLDAASKVVGRALTDDDQRRFVREFVAGGKR
jgi:F-type H+-transporting ATPase subunit b